MAFQRKELFDGIFFNAIPETKFKSNLLSIRFIVPLKAETAAKNALILPVLLRGSENFPNIGCIRREEESLYDSGISDNVSKRGDTQILELRANVLNNRFAIDGMDITSRVLSLMEDLLFHPVTEDGVFRKDYVESEKQKLTDDIRALVNDKRRYAMMRMVQEMFAGEDFGVSELGDEASVAAVCGKCLYAQYLDVLARARIEIFAVGDFDFDALSARFASMFASVKRGTVYSLNTTVMAAPRAEVKTVYEHQNVTQGKLSLGFYTGASVRDDDYHVMQLLNMIYGSGVTSKLFLNVREKLSLCYYCSSGENGQKGYLMVNSGIQFDKEQKTADEVLRQLGEIQKGNVSEDELRDAKLSMIDSIGRIADSTGAMMNWYFGCVMNGKMITPEEKRALVEAVTVADIVKKSQKIKLDTYYFLCGKEEN